MIDISLEEIQRLATLSALELPSEKELATVRQRLVSVLEYAQKVAKAPINKIPDTHKVSNIFADDVARPTNPSAFLALAPESQDDCFIVPAIIEKK